MLHEVQTGDIVIITLPISVPQATQDKILGLLETMGAEYIVIGAIEECTVPNINIIRSKNKTLNKDNK